MDEEPLLPPYWRLCSAETEICTAHSVQRKRGVKGRAYPRNVNHAESPSLGQGRGAEAGDKKAETHRFSVNATALVIRRPVELRFAACVTRLRELSTEMDFRIKFAMAIQLTEIANRYALAQRFRHK